MAALFLAAFGNTIVATLLPTIIADLGGFELYAWPSTAYMVTSTTALPIAGKLGDLYGRRPVFLFGVAAITISSLPVALSQSMDQLILFRAIQGIGGGAIMVTSIAAAGDLAPPEERGRYHGIVGAVFSLAALAGPLVGGFIIDHFHWRWAFLINLPLGMVVWIMLAGGYPHPSGQGEERLRVDYPGIALLVVATISSLLALSAAGVLYPWGSPEILGLLALGAVAGGLLLVVESRSSHAIIPLGIYRIRTVVVALAVSFLTGFVVYGSILFIPLFFQAVQGTSAGRSGALLVPVTFGIVTGAVLSGRLLSRSGGRYYVHALWSTALAAAGMFLLSTLNPETGLAAAVARIFTLGVGIGGVMSIFTVAVQNTVASRDLGAGTSTLQFHRAVGGTVGIAIMGAVVAQRTRSRLGDLLPKTSGAQLPEGWFESAMGAGTPIVSGPSAGTGLADAVADHFTHALAGALGEAFALAAAVAGLSLAATLFLPRRSKPPHSVSLPPS
ncbi:MAG: MDR family MFS transporter [Bryobacterales bacterium]|nr:MDR family MFS transporter [Bryobacterales bacterium]